MTIDIGDLRNRIVKGRILTPGELHTAASGLKQRPDLTGFALTGWVSEAEAALLESPDATRGVRFQLYPLPCGAIVAVSTLQANELQLRWYVPLIDSRPREWLRWSIAHSTLAALLEIGVGRQVTWCSLPLPFEPRRELEELLATPGNIDCAAAFAEAAMVNGYFAYDDAVSSCVPQVEVKQVRVVSVCDGLYSALQTPPASMAN